MANGDDDGESITFCVELEDSNSHDSIIRELGSDNEVKQRSGLSSTDDDTTNTSEISDSILIESSSNSSRRKASDKLTKLHVL